MKRTAHLLACILGLSIAASPALVGCASHALAATDLMADIPTDASASTSAASSSLDDEQANKLADFGVRLLQQAEGDDNVLVSPLSVEYALGMTANGAQGETLSQMEAALGLPVNQLNEQLHAVMLETEGAGATADTDDAAGKSPLKVANSIWLKNGFDVSRDFLQTNADWYDAGVYAAPFDESTRLDINQWTSDHTDGMIKDLLRDIPSGATMYLVNAIAFDAKWEEPYEESQVQPGTFTAHDSTEQEVDFMYSTEGRYLETSLATGFIRPYADSRYAFAALLPTESTSVDDLVAELDGAGLRTLLEEAQYATVDAALPKFESDYETDLAEALTALGMSDAFDANLADFTGMAPAGPNGGNLFINRVLHKTYVSVDERGTKAAAATAVEVKELTAIMDPEEPKVVHLDRPFVYLIVDQQTNLPVFIGTVKSIA